VSEVLSKNGWHSLSAQVETAGRLHPTVRGLAGCESGTELPLPKEV